MESQTIGVVLIIGAMVSATGYIVLKRRGSHRAARAVRIAALSAFSLIVIFAVVAFVDSFVQGVRE
jgi:drug/metabolite transporter (DMT)-like permease